MTGLIHWRFISNANVTSVYGLNLNSKLLDPENPYIIFSWLICLSYGDRGNAMVYEYKVEDSVKVDVHQTCELNSTDIISSKSRRC
jgi:Salmonella virulence plasmid 65kDa B protein